MDVNEGDIREMLVGAIHAGRIEPQEVL